MTLPKDPMMLLSVINTALRDTYSSLQALAESEDVDAEEIKAKLAGIDYEYDEALNKFV